MLDIRGFAVKPTYDKYSNPNNMVCIPTFKPNTWPITAIIKGKRAPPTMPVKRIPVKIEWFLGTEFNPKDIITDHMPEIENPKSLNDRTESSALEYIANKIRADDDRA